MYRKYRQGYGTSKTEHFDRMVVQPPVFASVSDAYLHFVRHPEERQLVEEQDVFPNYSPLDDFFDIFDNAESVLYNNREEGNGEGAPVPSGDGPSESAVIQEIEPQEDDPGDSL